MFQCVPQLIGLIRGEPKFGVKHRANGREICEEVGNERYSRSMMIDRTRSKENEYKGYRSGGLCWEAMVADANMYRIEGVNKKGRRYCRKLRADAVIGWAVKFCPIEEEVIGWNLEKRRKFNDDSWQSMYEIEPRLFRIENIRMMVIHRDEGVEHLHVIGDSLDEAGRYCGNLIDAALMVRINEEYPRKMRERGWAIEDVDQTDFRRMGKKVDEETGEFVRDEDGNFVYKDYAYRAERLAKRAVKRVGRSVSLKVGKDLERVDEIYREAQAALVRAVTMEQEAAEGLRAIQADISAREAAKKDREAVVEGRERLVEKREREQ